jgi:outer membrane protease
LDPETTEQIMTMIDQGALKFADWIKQEWTGSNKNEHEKTRMNIENKIEKNIL